MHFISPWKLFSFLRCFNFCFEFLVMQKNGLIRKTKQTIKMHIFSDMSKTKVNQTTKCGPLIEYNMKNIIVEKSFTKYDGKTRPRNIFKKSKFSISVYQQPEVSYSLFLYVFRMSCLRTVRTYWNPLAFTSYKVYLKQKQKEAWT